MLKILNIGNISKDMFLKVPILNITGLKMGNFDRCYVRIFRMFRLKKIANQFFIYTFAFESSGTYLYDPIPYDCSHTLSNLHFFERFFAKICGEMAFFSSFQQGRMRSFWRVFRLKTGWKVTRKWLEMGVLLGATLCRFAIICWYCVFPIFCDWR